jgi:hypothetical protein
MYVKMDLDGGGMNWIDLAQGRDGWQTLVNAMMNFVGSIKCSERLD